MAATTATRGRFVTTRIIVAGRLWGAMVVSSLEPDILPQETEARLTDFTELVATAIANSEARDEAARLAAEQAALRRVATLVAEDVPSSELFHAVAREVGTLLGADFAGMARFEDASRRSSRTSHHPTRYSRRSPRRWRSYCASRTRRSSAMKTTGPPPWSLTAASVTFPRRSEAECRWKGRARPRWCVARGARPASTTSREPPGRSRIHARRGHRLDRR
jgi:hypothetical protein